MVVEYTQFEIWLWYMDLYLGANVTSAQQGHMDRQLSLIVILENCMV